MSAVCWSCHTAINEVPISRKTVCPNCGRPARCCKNCSYYDLDHSNQCTISDIEFVGDKEASNFCDYFTPSDRQSSSDTSDDARKRFEDLFK